MTLRTALALSVALVAGLLRGAGLVPEYAITDTFVTSPTLLLRMGADGQVREIWTGMDAAHARHVPLFLETSIYGEIRSESGWLDLRTLAYHPDGTRPGYIRLRSDDGRVAIEVTARKNAGQSPIFVRYSFARAVDLRLEARFKYPQFTQSFRADDGAGLAEFTTAWRSVNTDLTTTSGPRLILAGEPAGRTLAIDKTGASREFDGAKEVLLCIDATEPALPVSPGQSYAKEWTARLGGIRDTEAQYVPGRVTLASDNPKLDRLFNDSVDAIVANQFASGDVMGDVFFYRDSWLRDGSYSMIGLALAGDDEAVERYFRFWGGQRDFSVGGEREAQQPAIAITAMWFYSRLAPDGARFLGSVWPYVSYFADYYGGRIAKEGMLHVSEEWICFIPAPSSWPNAEIYSGLRASAKIAAALGNAAEAVRWNASADRLRDRFGDQAYDKEKGRVIPMAGASGEMFTDPEYPKAESRNGPLRDERVDAGMLIIGRLEAFGRGQGILAVDDPRFASTKAEITRDLENPDHSIFRFGPNPSSPHAAQGELDTWPIIGAWAAQDEWLLGHTDLAWRYLISGVLNKRGYDAAASCDYLPENWDRQGVPDKPMITWSHGDFVTSVLLVGLGISLESPGADLGLAPSLPPGMDHAHFSGFRFRDWRLDIDLRREHSEITVHIEPRGPANETLTLEPPFGQAILLSPGHSAEFTVDPSTYYAAFGRSAHAVERARLTAQILTGKPPARDPATLGPAEVEAYLCDLETRFRPTAQ
jgi:hypothetical protein